MAAGYVQPECLTCADAARCRRQAGYCRDHLFAWADDRVIVCEVYRESRYHGREAAAKVLPRVESAPFFLLQTKG